MGNTHTLYWGQNLLLIAFKHHCFIFSFDQLREVVSQSSGFILLSRLTGILAPAHSQLTQ
jgi:hypothetical protein